MLFVNDPDGHTIYTDPVWRQLTGQDAARSLGTSWLNRVHAEDRAFTEDTHFAGVEANSEYSIQYRLLNEDESAKWVYVAARASLDPLTHAVLGFIGSLAVLPENGDANRYKTQGFIRRDAESEVIDPQTARKLLMRRHEDDPGNDLRMRVGAALEHSRQARRCLETECGYRTRVVLDIAMIELSRELNRLDTPTDERDK